MRINYQEKEMKKNVVCAGLMLVVFVCIAGAEGWRGRGYTGPSSIDISSVTDVKNMPHDTDVALEGKIESYQGNEKYLFNDGSDTITLEIDNDIWNGIEVGPDDIVIIYGEVDRKSQRLEIEVERIEKKTVDAGLWRNEGNHENCSRIALSSWGYT
jgi:uncharacterized protein (TIGR00156 family)